MLMNDFGPVAARQEATPANAANPRALARLATATALGALLLAGCGGGGGAAPLVTPAPVVLSGVPTAAAAPAPAPSAAPAPDAGSLPDGYLPDGTLPPPPPRSGPPSQNARGMTGLMIEEWNATCTAQPDCRIEPAQVEEYNRNTCDAWYPDDPGCYIGQ